MQTLTHVGWRRHGLISLLAMARFNRKHQMLRMCKLRWFPGIALIIELKLISNTLWSVQSIATRAIISYVLEILFSRQPCPHKRDMSLFKVSRDLQVYPNHAFLQKRTWSICSDIGVPTLQLTLTQGHAFICSSSSWPFETFPAFAWTSTATTFATSNALKLAK